MDFDQKKNLIGKGISREAIMLSLTLSICELQPLHELRLDLAYWTVRSLRVVFLFPFPLPEVVGPSVESVPPPEALSFSFSWSSQRRVPNPDTSDTDLSCSSEKEVGNRHYMQLARTEHCI